LDIFEDGSLYLIGHLHDLIVLWSFWFIDVAADHNEYVIVDAIEVVYILHEIPSLVWSLQMHFFLLRNLLLSKFLDLFLDLLGLSEFKAHS
jgi:hypothetical protein